MKPEEVRSLFLDFFRRKEHRIVPGTPVIPHGDPTLLFTNAGMNQFKDVFLGTGTRSYTRAADTQKCIRVSGKHNDLEVVGRDGYHHTFFEMLGNWSFGDYFKREAVRWAWEFMVEACGLPPGRLYATVFGGDRELGLGPDEEAEETWRSESGIGKERILRFGKKDNFWEMGLAGPCGPCSEIHIDLGPWGCDNPTHPKDGSRCAVNGDCARFLEVWNLVFIQYNRFEDGSLEKLPARHVDTGMGLERLSEIMRVREELARGEEFDYSNYNTGLFTPIFEVLHEITGLPYSPRMEPKKLVAYRVIADHVRALCIAIADGVMPDRKSRGSVLRSLLRRSARFGRQTLGIKDPFLHRLVSPVGEIFGGIFPEVGQRNRHIALVLEAEEKSFARTIERGFGRFASLVEKTRSADPEARVLDGFEAYRLYHQDGFPRDLIEQMAREEGFAVHEEQWLKAEEDHRKASESDALSFKFDLEEVKGIAPTRFVGYWERGEAEKEGLEAEAGLIKIIGNEALILDETPFYAESGGQVGDRGVIEAQGFRFAVHDTGKMGDIVIHYGEIEEADLEKLPRAVTARVDAGHRWDTAANHTSTHLLHWALRTVLGEHATQQGSLVSPDYLRFDFTHTSQVTPDQLQEIERLVNRRIFEDHPVGITVETIDEARKKGAMALFGEKYGETVRMIQVGDFSKELCGGTHLMRTGQAGYFKLQSETAVQSGVRRIVAVTRSRAVEESQRESGTLRSLARALSCAPESLPAKLEGLLMQIKELKKEAASAGKAVGGQKDAVRELQESAEDCGGVKLIIGRELLPGYDKTQLGTLADFLARPASPLYAGAIAGMKGDSISVTIFASPALAKDRAVDCGRILKAASEKFGRRGGGKAHFAQTGWKESDGIDLGEFLAIVKAKFKEALGA